MVQSSTGFISGIKVEEVEGFIQRRLASGAGGSGPSDEQIPKREKAKVKILKAAENSDYVSETRKKTRGRHSRDEEAIRGGSARTKIGSEAKEQRRKSRRRCPKTTVNAGNASVAYKTCG